MGECHCIVSVEIMYLYVSKNNALPWQKNNKMLSSPGMIETDLVTDSESGFPPDSNWQWSILEISILPVLWAEMMSLY